MGVLWSNQEGGEDKNSGKAEISAPKVTENVKETFEFPKVELHLHLDGAVRHSTIFELAQQKKIDLKGAKSVEDVRRLLVTHQPADLSKVLSAFDVFLPCIVGDKDAVERIAYELCEDQSNNGVVYFETRYSPHLLSNTANHKVWGMDSVYREKGTLDSAGVVAAVKRGLDRGEKEFGVKARSILCCIRGYESWNDEVLELATTLKDLGVVAIDVAGCAHGADEKYEPSVLRVFKEAAARGIHRTVHAGESGGPQEVIVAMEEMKAQRIGHGYRLLKDEAAYQKYAVQQQIHLEGCPYSSVMTGAVPLNWPEHPIERWARDGVNFSINTDDPVCFGNSMYSELCLAKHNIGISVEQLWKCQLNAAKSSFLPDEEKATLVQRILDGKPKENEK
jgi:adenosine deaminase